ncbi:MAG: FkbM family methyltransferase [Nostoc sp.]|uniref:FkbM family methyltransferase n=1 Tax=Nostoc sp. TaxID=1180 RepID=UPI002FF96CD0
MKHAIRKLIHRLRLDLRYYASSDFAKIKKLFDYHQIDLVLDVGANTGQYYNFLRELGYSGKVVSFEPLSDAYSQLAKMSKKHPAWQIAPRTAIGNSEGEISINISGNSQSSSLLPMLDSHKTACPESNYIGTETVNITHLDYIAPHYITAHNKVFLKLDVQGFEQQVLEGAKGILPQIKGIQLEMSLVQLYQGEPLFREMLDYMVQIGYSLHWLKPTFTDTNTGKLLQLDGIFFKP